MWRSDLLHLLVFFPSIHRDGGGASKGHGLGNWVGISTNNYYELQMLLPCKGLRAPGLLDRVGTKKANNVTSEDHGSSRATSALDGGRISRTPWQSLFRVQ